MHRVAAEIAQKILMLFEQDHIDAGPRQQIAGHHAGRPAAGDDAACRKYFLVDRHRRFHPDASFTPPFSHAEVLAVSYLSPLRGKASAERTDNGMHHAPTIAAPVFISSEGSTEGGER